MLLNSLLKVVSYTGGDISGRFGVENVLDKSNKLPHLTRPHSSSTLDLVLRSRQTVTITHLLAKKTINRGSSSFLLSVGIEIIDESSTIPQQQTLIMPKLSSSKYQALTINLTGTLFRISFEISNPNVACELGFLGFGGKVIEDSLTVYPPLDSLLQFPLDLQLVHLSSEVLDQLSHRVSFVIFEGRTTPQTFPYADSIRFVPNVSEEIQAVFFVSTSCDCRQALLKKFGLDPLHFSEGKLTFMDLSKSRIWFDIKAETVTADNLILFVQQMCSGALPRYVRSEVTTNSINEVTASSIKNGVLLAIWSNSLQCRVLNPLLFDIADLIAEFIPDLRLIRYNLDLNEYETDHFANPCVPSFLFKINRGGIEILDYYHDLFELKSIFQYLRNYKEFDMPKVESRIRYFEQRRVTFAQSAKEFECFLKDHEVTIVCFSAVWCGPCHAIKPYFVRYSDRFQNVGFLLVDVDEVVDIPSRYQIKSYPTFLFLKQGQRVAEIIGCDEEALLKFLCHSVKPP